jgi:hypothetical protein
MLKFCLLNKISCKKEKNRQILLQMDQTDQVHFFLIKLKSNSNIMKFKYYIDDELEFEGKMLSLQCKAIKPNGERCKCKVVIGLPYCWHHRNKLHVKIADSQIEDAGKGLFAFDKTKGSNDIIFRKGIKIVPYDGEIINKDTLDKRYLDHNGPYVSETTKQNVFIDDALERYIGSLVNHSRNNNAKLFTSRGKVSIICIKNIRNNQEITVNYGRNYKFDDNSRHTTK